MILFKKFRAGFLSALLCLAVCSSPAEELAIGMSAGYNGKKEAAEGAVSVRVKDDFFEAVGFMEDAANAEAAAEAISPDKRFAILGGNITKPAALSRLENPLVTDYTSAVSGVSAPAIGAKSAPPSAQGNHAEAYAARIAFPRIDFPAGYFLRRVDSAFAEFYANTDDVSGARIACLLSFDAGGIFKAKPTAQVNAGWYSYSLAPKETTTWFLPAPYFAPGFFSAFVAETVVRAPVFAKIPPVTLYAALGLPESPFGGCSPWTRAELGVPIPVGAAVLTLKGKVFYAENDFYTPKNSLVAARTKATGNISLGFLAWQAAAVNIGAAFGYDSHTEMYKARAGVSLSKDGVVVSLSGFFTNWHIDSAEQSSQIVATSQTAAGGAASVSKIFAEVKPQISASFKLYPGKEWDWAKTEYSAALSVAPRSPAKKIEGKIAPVDLIPTASLHYGAISYADSRFTNSVSASASWKFKTKKLSVTTKINMSFEF